jgi:hypothetical protein
VVSDLRHPRIAREGSSSRLLFKKRMFRCVEMGAHVLNTHVIGVHGRTHLGQPLITTPHPVYPRTRARAHTPPPDATPPQPPTIARRESDDDIRDAQFITLSYVQAQADFLAGNYPVVRDDAAQVCCAVARARARVCVCVCVCVCVVDWEWL